MCLTICVARIVDVSLATVKTIFIIKGKRLIASIIAFLEISIWLFIAKDVISGDLNIYYAIAYCCGFAIGTFIGISIEKLLAIGNLTVQAIIDEKQKEIINILRANDYGVTEIDCRGRSGYKILILIDVKRKNVPIVKKIIQNYDSKIFIKLTDTNTVFGGFFHNKTR